MEANNTKKYVTVTFEVKHHPAAGRKTTAAQTDLQFAEARDRAGGFLEPDQYLECVHVSMKEVPR